MIPACLWFVTRNKENHKYRNRRGEILFIDARKMGEMVDRRHRVLTDEDIDTISKTYHTWRGEEGIYEDIPGFCKSAIIKEIIKHNFTLTPGRYVGIEEEEEDDEPFEEKMGRLKIELLKQFIKSEDLQEKIKKNLEDIGYEL